MYAIYIYGNIYYQYTPFMLVYIHIYTYIYIPYMDPMGIYIYIQGYISWPPLTRSSIPFFGFSSRSLEPQGFRACRPEGRLLRQGEAKKNNVGPGKPLISINLPIYHWHIYHIILFGLWPPYLGPLSLGGVLSLLPAARVSAAADF